MKHGGASVLVLVSVDKTKAVGAVVGTVIDKL